jgi:long-chain acyl-CoA synthetase
MLLSQQFSTIAQNNLGHSAIRYLGKETSFGTIRTQIARLSYLYQNTLGDNPRVAFLARNSPAMITTFFALTNIRAVSIPVDPDLPPDETMEWIKAAQPTHIAVTSDLVDKARDLIHEMHLSAQIIEIEKKQGGEYDMTFTPPPENMPTEKDVILLMRTHGRTDKPKFTAFTHKQLHHSVFSLKAPYHTLPTDRFITTMSWAHPFAFVHGMLYPFLTGSTCVIDHGLQAVEFLDFLLDSRVTRIVGTPPFFHKLLVNCKNEKKFLPGTKSITVGLGQMSAELRKAFNMLKIKVSQCYGQTENVWTITMEDIASAEVEMGGGRPLPGMKYKVIDKEGDTIDSKDSRIGLLAVTGPTVMNGYPNMDQETKNAIRGTWLYTGDMARLEGDGDDLKIFFLGRKEDVIEIDGEYILPTPVDKVIRSLPGVKDAAAFVTKTSKNQKVVAVAVVKVENFALSEKQVTDACTAHVHAGLMPRAVAFTDFIPREPGGGVNYGRLRGQFSGITG